MRKLGLSILFGAALMALPQSASAGGLFYAGSGTKPLGRGAAFLVRADDPMALLYNPAALADLDDAQLLANFNLALLDACMDPAGTADETNGPTDPDITGGDDDDPDTSISALDGWKRDQGTYGQSYGAASETPQKRADVTRFGVVPAGPPSALRRSWLGTTMPKVCNDTGLLPIPNFVFTQQLFKKPKPARSAGKHGLTLAIGFVAPGAVAKTTWGNEDGTVRAKGHATADQIADAVPDSSTGTLGKRLPAGIRPDAVCDPDKEDCSDYCNPETDPTCPAGKQYFCDPGKYDCDLLPTPTRYMLVQQDPLAVPITIGVGYRPFPWLAVGGAFTYQAVFFKSIVYGVQTPSVTPELDMRIENELRDYFVPIVNASILVTPFRGLDAMAYFKWQDKMQGATAVTITDGAYTVGGPAGRLPVTTKIKAGDGIETIVPQPWEAGAGVRFALPVQGGFSFSLPTSAREDPMSTEWFDIEANFVLEHNSSVKDFVLKSKENPFDVFQGYDGDDDPENPQTDPQDPDCSTIPGQTRPDPTSRCVSQLTFLKEMTLRRDWKNQYVFRVGADVNIIPGVFTVRAGYNFETRGVTPALQSIDAFPSQRQGIHAGLTWRVGRFDLSAAYAHLFQEQIRVLPYGTTGKDAADTRASSPSSDTVAVNAGVYDVSWDVFSIGGNMHF
jgi:long-subunit fatty acid transport protein